VANPFTPAPYGPFTKGVWDSGNPSVELAETLKRAENWVFTGRERMSIRPGVVAQMTLYDDQGSPAPITTVCCIQPFSDGAIAIGYSSVTQKCYLYRLNATLTGWIKGSDGSAQSNTNAQPAAVIWSSMGAAPDVLCAEGLGYLYIANTGASSSATLSWATYQWDGTYPATLVTYKANGTYNSSGVGSVGTDVAYYLGVISFQSALWGWGYGTGAVASTGFRPELLSYSSPAFGIQFATDNFTMGDRVRSQRERVVGAGVAAQSLYVGGVESMYRITGTGRDSWTKIPVDGSFGFVGPKCMVTVGSYLYWWSPRGPMRISGLVLTYGVPPRPEPLYDPVYSLLQNYQNEAKVVAFFDPDRDTVGWTYDNGSGTIQTLATYDTQRGCFTGTDSNLGVPINCAGNVKAIFASTATPATGPQGPPTAPLTTNVTSSGATIQWTPGDLNAQTEISVALTSNGVYTVVTTLAAGLSSYTFGGQSNGTQYEWRVRHFLNGGYSSYLQPPTAGMIYTTLTSGGTGGGKQTLPAPTGLTGYQRFTLNSQKQPQPLITLNWTITDPAAYTLYAGSSVQGGPYTVSGQANPGVASVSIQYGFGVTPPQYWVVFAREQGFNDSPYSNEAKVF